MFRHLRITAVLFLGVVSASAVTLYDADLALAAGDSPRALAILDELLRVFPQNSEEGGLCLLRKAEMFRKLGRTDEAESVLRRVPGIPGMPDVIVSEAVLRRIVILEAKKPHEARESAKSWLRNHTTGADAASVRILLSRILRKEGDLRGALAALESRPASERKAEYDRPVADAEKRIRLALKADEKSAEIHSPSVAARFERDFREAAALRLNSPRKAAEAYGRIVAASVATPPLRLEAAICRVDCLDEAGDSRGALLAAAFLAGFDDAAPPARIAVARLMVASLTLDVGEDASRARDYAEDALAVLPPESDAADEARWLIARAALRRNASSEEVWEILSDSPSVKASPVGREEAKHPVNRLISAAGSLSQWVEADLHQRPPGSTTALLRAADECFAATRYAEAANRYAKAESFGSPPSDVRAYAALQRARAVALSPGYREAAALYRRFLGERALAQSPYAAGALQRAGNFCQGRLRDPVQAREFFRAGYENHPDSEPGQACLIYLAENLADSGDRKSAANLYRDYLKRYPTGHHAGAARNFLAELNPAKK